MNPETGTFTSMDTYGGSVFDPVSLHKYLYANANPVMGTDPSGYFFLADVVISEGIMANLAFYSISGGLIGFGLNLLRQLRTAQRMGGEIDWGEAIFAGIEGALLGSFFGMAGMLAASLSSAMIFIALGCSSLTFALLSLVQAGADWQNGDYDLFLFDLLFAFLGFRGAESCFNAAVTCSSASNTAGSTTNTSPENTNTATSPENNSTASTGSSSAGNSSANGNTTRTLYRGDRSTTLNDVFENGFQTRGTHNDPLLHTQSNTTRGNFVSTTSEQDVALGFAGSGRRGYLYVIETDNYVDINATYGRQAYFPEQCEFSIPGGVPSSDIVGAYPTYDHVISGDFIPNPNYGGN